MNQNMSDWDRIGQDLWPHHRDFLVKQALEAKEGEHIHLSDGEAETLARQETEREIAKRRRFYELIDTRSIRPKSKPHPNYVNIDL
jgi:hypothetical protein